MGIEKYKDIIEHPHHVSLRHPRMSELDRAAQFAPFAALTGYDDVIIETGRLTDSEKELDEQRAEHLNAALNRLLEHLPERPHAKITFFEKDSRKKGGRYRSIEGSVRVIDSVRRELQFVSGEVIPLDDIHEIFL